jgi:hypothetical protein
MDRGSPLVAGPTIRDAWCVPVGELIDVQGKVRDAKLDCI